MRRRNNRIVFYLNDKEYAKLSKSVEASKRSREEFIRCVLDGYSIREAPPVDYYNLICEVRRVGTNINQALKVANATGCIDAPAFRKALDENREVEKMLWRAFEDKKIK